jgi:predicted NBD/HSP70 family sugar kinase
MEQVIGLDIGGTKISGIVYDGKTILRELTVATPKNLAGFKQAVEKLAGLLSNGRQVKGLGIGIAGIVNDTGMVIYSPNMKFLENFNFGKFCKDLNFKKLLVDNDANCFALAEAQLGRGKAYKNFVGITLGTGVGGGIICERQLFRGTRGSAGEVGHIMADFKYDSEHYYQAARDKKDYKTMGEVLGLLFANLINILDVEAIVLGGTVAIKSAKDFLPHALKIVKKHVVNKNNLPKIIVSNLKNSGSLGAALLVI